MPIKKKRRQDKFAKAKLVAIPVLLGVLGFVLWSNTRRGNDESVPPVAAQAESASNANGPSQARPTNTPPSRPTPQSTAPTESTAEKKPQLSREPWPEIDELAFLDGPNPFASYRIVEVSEEPEEKVVEVVPKEPAINHVTRELAKSPLRYYFRSARKNVVMLGNQLLESGDHLTEELKLDDIDQEHLIFTLDRSSKDSNSTTID